MDNSFDSLLTSLVCLFLVNSNKFLGRFYTIGVTVSNQFSVFLECLPILVSHQKHTPESCAKRRSLTPKRCRTATPSIYSILLFFRWLRRDTAVTVSLTVSAVAIVSGVSVIIFTSPSYFRPSSLYANPELGQFAIDCSFPMYC